MSNQDWLWGPPVAITTTTGTFTRPTWLAGEPRYTGTDAVVQKHNCNWYKAEGSEYYMFFTSCGVQIDYDREWWKHCPKCGGSIVRPSDRDKESP